MRLLAARVVYTPSGVTLRIGTGDAAALVEVALEIDETDPDDPSWYVTLTTEQTALLVDAAYRYAFIDDDTSEPMLIGGVPVSGLPLAAA
jgi:hypothetical protein